MQLPFKVLLLPKEEDLLETKEGKSSIMQMFTGGSFWDIFCWYVGKMRAVPQSVPVSAKEQLPKRHEDLLPAHSNRLEHFHCVSPASSGAKLHH
jgi:hypothetical protein